MKNAFVLSGVLAVGLFAISQVEGVDSQPAVPGPKQFDSYGRRVGEISATIHLHHTDVDVAQKLLERAFPGLKFSIEERTDSVSFSAMKDEVEKIRHFATLLDSREEPVLTQGVSFRHIKAKVVERILWQAFPGTKTEVNDGTNTLSYSGTQKEIERIQTFLELLEPREEHRTKLKPSASAQESVVPSKPNALPSTTAKVLVGNSSELRAPKRESDNGSQAGRSPGEVPLANVYPQEAIDVLVKAFPQAYFAIPGHRNSLLVGADPEERGRILALIKLLESRESPQTTVMFLTGKTRLNALSALLERIFQVAVKSDEQTNSLHIRGLPAQVAEAKAFLKEFLKVMAARTQRAEAEAFVTEFLKAMPIEIQRPVSEKIFLDKKGAMASALDLLSTGSKPSAPSGAADPSVSLAPPADETVPVNIVNLGRIYDEREAQARQLAATISEMAPSSGRTRTPDGPERTARKVELRQRVAEAFEARQQLERAELDWLRQRLMRTEQQIEHRGPIKDQVIDRRVDELLNPALEWDTSKPQPGTQGPPSPAASSLPGPPQT